MSRNDRFDDEYPAGRVRKWRFGAVLSGLLTLILIGVGLAAAAFFYFETAFTGEGPSRADATFLVRQGSGLAEIADNLQEHGLISDSRIFIAGAFLKDSKHKLKAGEFNIPARASMEEILDTLVNGKPIQHKLTVPEGLTSEQVAQRVREHPVLVGELTEIPAEGTILPDTYIFLRGMTRQQLIKRMQDAQKAVIEELWPKRAKGLPLKSPREAVILASIVEKETGKAGERARVASVFINRLRRNIRLQSDPTIIYGIVGGKGALDRPILKSDIARKTPYNTYQINGLPPTPIANPGRAAIEAVLQPAESNDLYFVADGTGGHAFAETLREHRKNVALWRQIEAERRRLEQAEARQSPKQDAEATKADTGEVAAARPAPASPPPPPAPPSAAARQAGVEAAPVPAPKPKPQADDPAAVVASRSVEDDAAASPTTDAGNALRDSVGLPTRTPSSIPKPRPRPDHLTAAGAGPDPAPAPEPEAQPAVPAEPARPTEPVRIGPAEPRQLQDSRQTGDQGFGR